MKRAPNIVIFNPDQWRGDVMGHLGNPAAVTPNLNALVSDDAVSFSNAFCQNPVCTPSRCSFMTGWYPHVAGHRTMQHMLRRHEPVLLKTLKDNGYFVWWGGKNDLVPGQLPLDPFCDVKFEPEQPPDTVGRPPQSEWRGDPDGDNYYSFYVGRVDTGGKPFWDNDRGCVNGAVDFIKDSSAAADGRPFCIYLPLHEPHPEYQCEEPYYSMIDPSRVPDRAPTPTDWTGKPSILCGLHKLQQMRNWSEDRLRELRRTYYGQCARVDAEFGLIVDALKAAGVYDDTAIFFFSDHGDFTGDYGLVEKTQNTFEDCLTHVPFLIKPPKGIPVKPRVSDALVELIDFPATVEALTGITPAHTHFGRSLLPVLSGETDEHRDAVFCEGGRIYGETHCMELESTSSGNPAGLYWPRMHLQEQEAPYHTKAAMCRTRDFKYVMRLYETDELYDLRSDPRELDNLIDRPEYAGTLAALKDRLLRFFLETGDVVPHDTDERWPTAPLAK
ncbi:MAG: sulfatase-like hydrolase/transferase [Planctomycetota bacterium]|jgi:arylsulfatase A-like enzyme